MREYGKSENRKENCACSERIDAFYDCIDITKI